MATLDLTATPRLLTPAQEVMLAESVLNPVLFCRNLLHTEPWQVQEDILRSIASNPKTAVKACHSSGKTKIAAVGCLWWLARYEEAIVVTTSASQLQVEKILWAEIHGLLAKSLYPYPPALLTELKFTSRRFATGFATSVTQKDSGVRFQGFHSPHLLIIVDEAVGIDAQIWSAIEGARAGGHVSLLVLGNPTIGSGPFHDCFHANRDSYHCITISAFDTPNLAGLSIDDLLALSEDELDINPLPFLTTKRWVKERYEEWGPGHPLYQSRVLGRFPEQSEEALLSLGWLEAAKASSLSVPAARCKARAGLDVAGPGEDLTVLSVRRGPRLIVQKTWADSDPRGEVVAALNPFKEADDLESVNVDSIGIGWGMYTHLTGLGFATVPVNVGEAARDTEKFANLKSELYWGLRLRAQAGDLSGLVDDKAIGQLAGIRYSHDPRGRIVIESKESMRKRGVKSPDLAESVMLCYADLGAGGAIYARSFTEDLIYDPSGMSPGFGHVGSYEARCIAVCYGAAKPMCWIEILDCDKLFYVTREFWFDGSRAPEPKTDAAYAADLETFANGVDPLTGEKVSRNARDAIVIVSDAAEHFIAELRARGMYTISADEELLQGIQLVGSLLDRKMLRVSSSCKYFIQQHKTYCWDRHKAQQQGIEEPQAVNGETCTAFRFFCKTRISEWRLFA